MEKIKKHLKKLDLDIYVINLSSQIIQQFKIKMSKIKKL